MQPLQYDLRSSAAEDNSITHAAAARSNLDAAITLRSATTASQDTHRTMHTGTTTRCRTQRSQPHPPHTRGTFHRRLRALYTEKYKVSCSGFLPKTKPMQHSCSHSNAICNHSFKQRIELRTQEQPLVAEHRGGNNRVRNDRSRNRRTHEVPFIAGAPASSPKQSPCNIHAAIPLRLPPHNTEHATFMQLLSPLPLVTTSLRHHFPSSPLPFVRHTPLVTTSLVMYCYDVKSHTTLHQGQFFSDVLLCNVKSHATLHQGQFFSDVLLCNVKSHTTLHQGQFFSDVSLCKVKSRTTLHQGQFFCDVLLRDVKSHTALPQGNSFVMYRYVM